MSLASIFNIPGDAPTMAAWSFSHMAHHRDIIRRLYQTRGLVLDEYAIDPINMDNIKGFLDQHQIMHQQFSSVLGLPGFDLAEVTWTDRGQRGVWIDLNARAHRAASDLLGV